MILIYDRVGLLLVSPAFLATGGQLGSECANLG